MRSPNQEMGQTLKFHLKFAMIKDSYRISPITGHVTKEHFIDQN